MTSLPPPPSAPAPPPPALPTQQGPALPGRRPRGMRGWPPWLALVALLSGFGATIVGTILAVGIATSAGVDVEPDLPPGLNIGLTVFQNVAFFVTALLFARTVSRPRAQDFGLRAPQRLRRAIGVLFAVWGTFFFLSAAWALALKLDEKSDLPERLGADLSTPNLLIVTFLVFVVAPVGEELFFRGFFFGALRNWRGAWPAAIITGITFAAFHYESAPIGQLVPLAIFGVGLCMLYHWTGSLYLSIALHAINNAIAFGAGEEQWRWWIVLLAIAGAVVVSLAMAAAIGRLLGTGSRDRSPATATAV